MNTSQIHDFLAGPIENVVHLEFKQEPHVPKLVKEAISSVETLASVKTKIEILSSKDWQVFTEFKSERFDFSQKVDGKVRIKDFMLAFTKVDNVYYVFQVTKIYYNQQYNGFIDSNFLQGGFISVESQESLYHYVIETLREELDTYTTKEVVQLKNL